MPVSVQIPTPLRQHTQGKDAVDAEGGTVKEVLDDVGRQFPGITQRLFDNGQVRRFVNVYVNEEDIRYLNNLETPVKDGDQVSIIPAVAGGSVSAQGTVSVLGKVLTMREIKELFDEEWVLLQDPQVNEMQEVLSGKLLCHSPDREVIDRAADQLPSPRHLAFYYIRNTADKRRYLL